MASSVSKVAHAKLKATTEIEVVSIISEPGEPRVVLRLAEPGYMPPDRVRHRETTALKVGDRYAVVVEWHLPASASGALA